MLFCTAKTSRVIRVRTVLQGIFCVFDCPILYFDAFFSNIYVISINEILCVTLLAVESSNKLKCLKVKKNERLQKKLLYSFKRHVVKRGVEWTCKTRSGVDL